MKMYLVGGAVRDKLMGKTPKDFDYTVVMDNGDHCDLAEMNRGPGGSKLIGPEIDFFTFMGHKLRKQGFKVFVMTPEHLTIRAHFPNQNVQPPIDSDGTMKAVKITRKGLTADFVLARKEGAYSDGRRPDFVEVGTLEDDLARRDFTMNAIAEDESGNFIDPFDGQKDLTLGLIRCVGHTAGRFNEDPLRMLRALRFSITLGFRMDYEVANMLDYEPLLEKLRISVSDERKMDELNKAFRHDPLMTLDGLQRFKKLRNVIFAGKVNLEATMKQKGFN